MKQPRVIQRLSSLLLATFLLFTAVWGQGGLMAQHAMSAKAVKEQQKATDSHTSDAQLTTASFEAVVTPAISFDFNQTAFLLPAPTLLILLLLSVPLLRYFTIPHYYFSFFRHVFGHHIATNAP
ncbi:hypothetical protein BN8_05820 [Fibrisoma limi BUZ 3]|uniref:Uncharacterized protein n=1 Tax=Fibrisoma limi BUZ 3 TaxID=1185876 RepID=I2GRF2_9BACT|nr:hypothetical protein [Fibrisoma limi]CCH56480.1 hypothetical protein BN8_05820 [Fibrisoma limi BUZ 3]